MGSNGRLAASELTAIGNGQYLANAAAAAWFKMVAACAAATGVTMFVTPGDGGYRDWASQQYRYAHPQGPVPIAPPGSSSHGLGLAVDINNITAVYPWLRANAARFGFDQQFASESWHWRYNGANTAGTTGTEITNRNGDNDMPRILNIKTIDGQGKADGKIYVDGPGGIRHVDNPDDLSFLQRYIADKPGDVLYQSQLDRVNLYLKPAAAVLDYSKLSDVQKAILDAVALIPKSGGSAVDVQPVLTAISALKFPTAEDIAVKVRSKIIAPE